MFPSIQTFLKSPFLRQNIVFFVGSVLVGVLNYAYYPLLGRLLTPDAYGELQAVVSLYMQLTILLGVLSQVTVNVVANYTDEARKQRVIFELEKFAFFLTLGLLIIGSLISWELKSFFNFDSVWPFILLLVVMVISVPATFRAAFLRAHLKFGLTSAVNFLGALAKLVFSVALVYVGMKVLGGVAGILIGQCIALGYAAYKARQLGFIKPPGGNYFKWPEITVIKPEIPYAAFVLICSVGITLFSSIDVFVVKHYFDAHTAGEYAGISTIGKIIFFLTSSIAQVLLPSVRIHQPKIQNRLLFLKSLIILTVIGGGTALVFSVAPTMIVGTLMGENYLPFASLLPLLSLAIFLISVVNLIVSYYIALRNYQLIGIIIPGICMTVILMWASHNNVRDVVVNLIYSSIAILVLCVMWRGMRLIPNWRKHVRIRPKANFNSSSRV